MALIRPFSFTSPLGALGRLLSSSASNCRISSASTLVTLPSSFTSPTALGGVGVMVGVAVAERVGVVVGVAVFVGVTVLVGVTVVVAVAVLVGVLVLVGVFVMLGVFVIVGVLVMLGVFVIVGVSVSTGVLVIVGVSAGVGVLVGSGVSVSVGTGVLVGRSVAVGTSVAVGVSGVTPAILPGRGGVAEVSAATNKSAPRAEPIARLANKRPIAIRMGLVSPFPYGYEK